MLCEVEQVLVLSTSHMPRSLPDFGPLRIADHEHGYIVFMTSEEDWLDGPEWDAHWLKPIVALAKNHGCAYINFDSDGGTIDNLKTWEW